ncbi:MAG: ABC transporter substrate-binding protein, partial [Thermoanaerobaculia bacterium]
ALQCTINKTKWEALAPDLQQVIASACAAENDTVLAEFNARSGPALATLVREHGVQLRQFPKSVLTAFGKASGELMQELYDQGDEITKKICASYFKFRREALAWTRIGDQAYANARLLDFPYPTG